MDLKSQGKVRDFEKKRGKSGILNMLTEHKGSIIL